MASACKPNLGGVVPEHMRQRDVARQRACSSRWRPVSQFRQDTPRAILMILICRHDWSAGVYGCIAAGAQSVIDPVAAASHNGQFVADLSARCLGQ